MSIKQELLDLGAPRKVVEAGEEIDKAVLARSHVPYVLQAYVREWVTKHRSNNKYGR